MTLTQGSPLVNWVRSWFYEPGCDVTPDKPRMRVYFATVALIWKFISQTGNKKDLKTIHDFLTYLLLGCNPVTGWKKDSDYSIVDPPPPPQYLSEELWNGSIDSFKTLLNFETIEPASNPYNIITCLSKLKAVIGNKKIGHYVGERVTMLTLSLWLLDKTTVIPTDIPLVRSCLDLAYRERQLKVDGLDHEYASSGHDLMYTFWINDQISRFIRLNVPSAVLLKQSAFIGWFCSLIRAHRTLQLDTIVDDKCKAEVSSIYNQVVDSLKTTLDASPMNIVREESENKSDLGATNWLFKIFRKYPPPKKKYGVKTSVN